MMKAATKKVEVNHAEQNGAAWYGTICEQVAALEVDYDRLEELRDERQMFTDEFEEAVECVKFHHNGVVDPNGTNGEHGEYRRCKDELLAWKEENGEEYEQLTEAATVDGELQKDADAVRERIQEGPLSVEVRSDWHAPGDEGDASKPAEFCILLSTGGPALRICGDLNEHGQPSRAYLQYQDWGTPWTDYFPGSGSGDVLLTYCQQFYFGE